MESSSENFNRIGNPTSVDDISTVVSSLATDSSTIRSREEPLDIFGSNVFTDSACMTDTKKECNPEEDPYQWAILLGGFLAQAISMCTLSSW
ncbi:unnamed protein product [Rhizopus stolonifer]